MSGSTKKLRLKGPILIIRTDAIGDLLLTTPMVTMLKRAEPELEIDLLAGERAAHILEGTSEIRRVLVDPLSFWERVRTIRRGDYHWAILARPEPSLAFALWLAGVPFRVGTSRRLYSPLFNRPVRLKRKLGGRHEAEYNAELLGPMGISNERIPWVKLEVTDEQRDSARELLDDNGLAPDLGFVVVHPGSRGSAPNLPYATYGEIVRGLREMGMPVVLTGSEEEVYPLAALVEQGTSGGDTTDAPLVNLAGQTSLPALIGVLAGARLMIASSTGPMHLAAATGTPVIVPYGLRPAISATRWKPWVAPEHYTLVLPGEAECPERCTGRCGREGCLATLGAESFLRHASSRLKGLVRD